MRFIFPKLLSVLLACASGVAAADSPSTSQNADAKRIILELKSKSLADAFRSKIDAVQGLEVNRVFNSDVFPGLSLRCSVACDEEALRNLIDNFDQDVAGVYDSKPVRMVSSNIESRSNASDTPEASRHLHELTGVNEMHQKGYFGEGALVAVIDSGIQYTHPALGGGIGPDHTVVGGYDLIGQEWPDAPKDPDQDPMDGFGHGTHVAGIIAGKSDRILGVAPEAKLLAYRVLSDSGYSDEETVIDGFLRAFESKADIITASVGELGGFTFNALAIVASRIVDQGVVVTFAAGNDGENGPFAASNGASGAHVLTVGAAELGNFSYTEDGHHYPGYETGVTARPARYSSWGATYDMVLKPDIVAPGSKILSTYPTDDYKELTGTSMATPYVAGVLALYVGKHGGRSAHEGDPAWAKRLIARAMSTAHSMPWADHVTSEKDFGFWAPTPQVGAGFIDARKILDTKTEVSFDGRKFMLNDTANFVGTHFVEVKNQGSKPVTYNFTLQDAGGFEAWIPVPEGEEPSGLNSRTPYYFDLKPVKMIPDVSFPEGEFTVEPGKSKKASFTFEVPSGLDPDTLPVYSGRVLIQGDNGDDLAIPYFGVASDIRESVTTTFDTAVGYPWITIGNFRPSGNANFTFNLTRAGSSYPSLQAGLVWGAAELRWDIFEESWDESQWTYPPKIGEEGYLGSATYWRLSDRGVFDPSVDDENDVVKFPEYAVPHGPAVSYSWFGELANGSRITPGDYQFRIAALRPFADPSVSGGWDIWNTTGPFTVLPLD